jgi:hypothetical protein
LPGGWHGLQRERGKVGKILGRVDAAKEDGARFGVEVVLLSSC